MGDRKRKYQLKFYVDEGERNIIYEKMKILKTSNMGAYMRKMAIDGYILNLDMSEFKEMTTELHKIGVNINQIAKVINETKSVYQSDIEKMKNEMSKLWQMMRTYILNLK